MFIEYLLKYISWVSEIVVSVAPKFFRRPTDFLISVHRLTVTIPEEQCVASFGTLDLKSLVLKLVFSTFPTATQHAVLRWK